LSDQLLQLGALGLCEEGHQVISHISFVDKVRQDRLEGAGYTLTIVGVQDAFKDFKYAAIDFAIFHQVALQNFDANVHIFFEELSVDFLPFPQNDEVDLQRLFYQIDAVLLVLEEEACRLVAISLQPSLAFLLVHGFGYEVSMNFLLFEARR
jgi:hypothetical protein